MHAGQLRHQLAQQALDAGLRHASGSGGRNSAQRAMRESAAPAKDCGDAGKRRKRHSSITKAKTAAITGYCACDAESAAILTFRQTCCRLDALRRAHPSLRAALWILSRLLGRILRNMPAAQGYTNLEPRFLPSSIMPIILRPFLSSLSLAVLALSGCANLSQPAAEAPATPAALQALAEVRTEYGAGHYGESSAASHAPMNWRPRRKQCVSKRSSCRHSATA